VAVTPDGARIVTGAADNTARVWDLFPSGQALIEQAKRMAPRCLTAAQRERYHLPPTPPHWCDARQKWPSDAVTFAQTFDLSAGRRREAISAFTKAIASDPSSSDRFAPRLASIHDDIAWETFLDAQLRGKPVAGLIEILPDADKAVALAPDWDDIRARRALIYLAVGRVDEALADLDKVIARGLEIPRTFYGRGRCHELKGNRDAATADYRKTLELIRTAANPDDYEKSVAGKARERLAAIGVPVPVEPAQ
jgi:tetratricopeptide (TPR) repeat protein